MQLILDNHNHTISSGHAYSTIKEIAEEAARRGIKAISITDHGPRIPGSCHRMHFLSLSSLPDYICGVRVFPGAEVNILNEAGEVDLDERALKRLTTVIASFHPHCNEGGDIATNTNSLLAVMDNRFINIIGHPGDPRFMLDIEKVVEKAAITNTAIEINNTACDPDCNKYPSFPYLKEIIKECIRKNVSLSFGSDSHFYTEVGDFHFAEPLIDELGIPEHLIINYSIDGYMDFVNKKRSTLNV